VSTRPYEHKGVKLMLGAIVGDIVGSRFERYNHKDKHFELFTPNCSVTDDGIMSLAVAKAIMEAHKAFTHSPDGSSHSDEYYSLVKSMAIRHMQDIGRRYPSCGYGKMFSQWVMSSDPQPYNSFGNGAAMRISPVGFVSLTESEARNLSEAVTAVTHNHSEGIKGAEATAVAIYMSRRGSSKAQIRDKVNRDYYNMDFTIDSIRPTYKFSASCQDTVPQAIQAFLESTSFEDTIRTAISLGGDSDTLAAIAGSIADAYYGVPDSIRHKALGYLNSDLRAIFDEWCEFMKGQSVTSRST